MLSQSGTSVITSTESPISVNYVQQNEQQNECECQTNFDSSKGLKVNYFANGFENAQDYLRAKRHRRLLLSNEKRRKAEIAAYDYMIQIYLFFLGLVIVKQHLQNSYQLYDFSERLEKWKKRNEIKSPLKTGSILTAETSEITFPYYGDLGMISVVYI